MDEMVTVFEKEVTALGCFSIRPFDLETDISVIHAWVNMDYASFWMLGNSSPADVKDEYRRIMSTGHTDVFMGYYKGQPVFLTEIYDPGHEEIGAFIESQPGDYGMHLLVGPTEAPIANFTSGVFYTIMSFLFESMKARRVLVEPDIANTKIHQLNRRFGFTVLKDKVELSNKIAQLEQCSPTDFNHAVEKLGY